MKQLFGFLKTTLLGGVLLVLPAWLAVLFVVKAIMHLQIQVASLCGPNGVFQPEHLRR